jgi:hypothetical protein
MTTTIQNDMFDETEKVLARPLYASQEPTRLREMRKILQRMSLEPEGQHVRAQALIKRIDAVLAARR